MNIKEAKEQIKNAMKAYFTKNKYGGYVIPIEKQRPVFLMGPPGIGKTAIMEQIASELGVGLVSYSMTHHTRQSALGLPFIVKKEYAGEVYDVSEYTMSEIIASVYDTISETGYKEGILFLDEINCVSETLAPSMLQFLQYKIFGRHHVPDGWIVVTAGNPPEYNNSVREFDIVTWDRLKRIDIEPNFDVWKEYAYKIGVHASILSYLEIKKADFYKIETTVDGKSFVTARGWSDLSDMIQLYELHNIPVNENLVKQYIQNAKIAKDFAIYYDLFNKYKADYQIEAILAGKATEELVNRAKNARFDERLSLLSLLVDGILTYLREVYMQEGVLTELIPAIQAMQPEFSKVKEDFASILEKQVELKRKTLLAKTRASSLSEDDMDKINGTIAILEEERELMIKECPSDGVGAFKLLKKDFEKRKKTLGKTVKEAGEKLSCLFQYCEEAFGDGQELLILVTELTLSYYGTHYISRYGCQEYFKHNKELLFYERQKEIIKEVQTISLMDA